MLLSSNKYQADQWKIMTFEWCDQLYLILILIHFVISFSLDCIVHFEVIIEI